MLRFRDEVVGATDPATAAESCPSSIRGHFFKHWQSLGLSAQPHVGDNVIHGSASPLEAHSTEDVNKIYNKIYINI